MQRNPSLAALLVALALGTGACGAHGESLGEASSASFEVKPVQGTSLHRVTLSAAGYRRAGIALMPVRPAAHAEGRSPGLTEVPASAVWYDAQGRTWVYVQVAERQFVRGRVDVLRYAGNQAVLSRGPVPGELVVKVGAAELYGAEQGVPGE
ncbi:MAG TPA: hypothetical protein VI452_04325 [Marmoricola sp.]